MLTRFLLNKIWAYEHTRWYCIGYMRSIAIQPYSNAIWWTTLPYLKWRCLYSRHRHGIFGHWKAVTAIFLTLTLILTLWKKNFENVKNNHSVGVEHAAYAQCNLNMLPLATEAIDLVVIFAILTYMGKENDARKSKTNIDRNPNTNPNPKPAIDKAAKRKELNKVFNINTKYRLSSGQKYRACDGCIDTLIWNYIINSYYQQESNNRQSNTT